MTDWDDLLEEYGSMVWRTACRLLGRTQDAEDCVQETFVSAVQLAQRERVKHWEATLRHLATARAIDLLRKRGRVPQPGQLAADPPAAASADPAGLAEANELAERLRSAMAQLAPRQAEVFALRFMEEMSYRQIARVLGISVNAVSVLLHDARQRLRALLGEDEAQ